MRTVAGRTSMQDLSLEQVAISLMNLYQQLLSVSFEPIKLGRQITI
jgi:hypothetical protein